VSHIVIAKSTQLIKRVVVGQKGSRLAML